MASKNRVNLLGNLGRDPEQRYLPDGTPVTTVSLATSEAWRDKQSGERRERTEWHRIVFFGELARIAGEYLIKGSSIDVEGRLRTRKWTDKDGTERYATEIVAQELVMLGGKRKEGGPEGRVPVGETSEMEENVPF